MRTLIYVLSGIGLLVVLGVAGAMLYGFLRPRQVRARQAAAALPTYEPVRCVEETAVLIACHNGAGTIATAVSRALANGVDVYVVSDASTDHTAEVAAAAGAQVLELTENVGKPSALYAAYRHFRLAAKYRAVAILDDDVMVEPDFVSECLYRLGPDTVIAVGRNLTWWPREKRWNLWLANRAYSYWNYQVTVRWIQSVLNVMNCISGSNSLYRTELLSLLLDSQPPYIVDDTYWVLETHRRRLGRVVYAPRAVAYLQDPTTFRDWYRQNVRWLWGTFQGVIGHRVGAHFSRFDLAYLALILNWVLYVVGAPLFLLGIVAGTIGAGPVLYLMFGIQGLWIILAAWRTGHPRLVLFLPPIVVTDLIYRVVMVHGLIKAIRQPTVDSCKWTSPARIQMAKSAEPAGSPAATATPRSQVAGVVTRAPVATARVARVSAATGPPAVPQPAARVATAATQVRARVPASTPERGPGCTSERRPVARGTARVAAAGIRLRPAAPALRVTAPVAVPALRVTAPVAVPALRRQAV